jgi:hypothetical protein
VPLTREELLDLTGDRRDISGGWKAVDALEFDEPRGRGMLSANSCANSIGIAAFLRCKTSVGT